MTYDPKNFKMKSVYLPLTLTELAEAQAKAEFMNFSAYIRKLIIKDLKENNVLWQI